MAHMILRQFITDQTGWVVPKFHVTVPHKQKYTILILIKNICTIWWIYKYIYKKTARKNMQQYKENIHNTSWCKYVGRKISNTSLPQEEWEGILHLSQVTYACGSLFIWGNINIYCTFDHLNPKMEQFVEIFHTEHNNPCILCCQYWRCLLITMQHKQPEHQQLCYWPSYSKIFQFNSLWLSDVIWWCHMGQYWLRYWQIAWWPQAIIWTSFDLSSLI